MLYSSMKLVVNESKDSSLYKFTLLNSKSISLSDVRFFVRDKDGNDYFDCLIDISTVEDNFIRGILNIRPQYSLWFRDIDNLHNTIISVYDCNDKLVASNIQITDNKTNTLSNGVENIKDEKNYFGYGVNFNHDEDIEVFMYKKKPSD